MVMSTSSNFRRHEDASPPIDQQHNADLNPVRVDDEFRPVRPYEANLKSIISCGVDAMLKTTRIFMELPSAVQHTEWPKMKNATSCSVHAMRWPATVCISTTIRLRFHTNAGPMGVMMHSGKLHKIQTQTATP